MVASHVASFLWNRLCNFSVFKHARCWEMTTQMHSKLRPKPSHFLTGPICSRDLVWNFLSVSDRTRASRPNICFNLYYIVDIESAINYEYWYFVICVMLQLQLMIALVNSIHLLTSRSCRRLDTRSLATTQNRAIIICSDYRKLCTWLLLKEFLHVTAYS